MRIWSLLPSAAFARPGPRLVDGIEALAAIAPRETPPGPDIVTPVTPTAAAD